MLTLNDQKLIVSVDSEHGGKVVEIFDPRLKRNLLLGGMQSPVLMQCEDGAVFSICGWDEAVPTLEPENGIPRLGWAWRSRTECIEDGDSVLTRWRMPHWDMTRTIVTDSRSLTSDYLITNRTSAPRSLLWAAHTLYPVPGLMEVILPKCEPVPGPMCDIDVVRDNVDSVGGFWSIREFSDIGRSWKFFVRAAGEVELRYFDVRLVLRTSAPWWGIWLNRGGLCDTCCVGIEPTLSPTDHASQTDCTVQPGASVNVNWSLRIL